MSKLWLTYAWKDNEDQDIDHVIQCIRDEGVETHYDRYNFVAGRRLWQQIDAAIKNPEISAWAIAVSKNSLASEACQEEIAYALDRCLRQTQTIFPLIGIFFEPIDPILVPSALATRLYVNLQDPAWASKVASSVTGVRSNTLPPTPEPYGFEWHIFTGKPVLEVWPRSGRWFPFVGSVPANECNRLNHIIQGPKGAITGSGMTMSGGRLRDATGAWEGELINESITSLQSAQLFFNDRPTKVQFGQPNGPNFFEMNVN